MKVRCVWFQVIWALTCAGEILLLQISGRVNVVLDMSLRNTSGKWIYCLSHPICAYENSGRLCITLRIIDTTWILTEIHAHCLLRELLLTWEGICKHSIVNVKVMSTRNITQMSDYPSTTVRIKYILFVYKNTHKMLDRNLGEIHLFS
jgi:hypothetical protein